MRTNKGNRNKGPAPVAAVSDTVCYCNGQRDLNVLEVFCTGCSKWFHANCLRDMKEFYGVCFMVCYVFTCKDCSPTKTESWIPKQASFSHMAITVLANLTAETLKAEGRLNVNSGEGDPVYFGLYEKILPYFDNNWENLTSMPRRAKNTWHQTLQKALAKETGLFRAKPGDENSFCLVEPLVDIGPANEAVKSIGKKTTTEKTKENLSTTLVNSSPSERTPVDVDDGPKTRGASKRRNADVGGGNTTKKPKLAADYSVAKFAGLDSPVDIPFNKEGYRYFLVERDPNVSEKAWGEEDESTARAIPSHMYRIVTTNSITLSPNDRAYQLRVSDDQLTVTGFEGYCVAKGTHSVSKGTWYYEVNFLKQPPNTHVRIGWSRGQAPVQACVGYNKFSYAWRSLKGTKFHDAKGKTYFPSGFKEGDVLGLQIHIPHDIHHPEVSSKDYLPPARKECHLINFKHNYFYEAQDDFNVALKALKEVPGSKIEFFLNGKSCGVAFEDIYRGFYFPAVSLFGPATIRVNFGPALKHLPKGARAMSERPQEVHFEQTLSDIMHLMEHNQVYE